MNGQSGDRGRQWWPYLMPIGCDDPAIHRIVQGRRGTVTMAMELDVRFDYGAVTPWVRRCGDGQLLVAGSEALRFHSPGPRPKG